MKKEMCDVRHVALSVGIVSAILHTAFVLLSRVGLISYWEWAHLATVGYTLAPFNVVGFVIGIVGAFVLGSLVGALFAWVYNATQ